MPSKNYTLFFIFSVGFVLISIAFITILGQTSKKEEGNADIRAKATVANSLKFVGVISVIDDSARTITVDQVRFESKASESVHMGAWTVMVPDKYILTSIPSGSKVLLNVDAATFNTSGKTMTALAINRL